MLKGSQWGCDVLGFAYPKDNFGFRVANELEGGESRGGETN